MLVVPFDALLTELMEASPDALGLTVDARTDLALNQVLEPLEELGVHDLVALVTVRTKYTGLRNFEEEAACNKIRKSIRCPRVHYGHQKLTCDAFRKYFFPN